MRDMKRQGKFSVGLMMAVGFAQMMALSACGRSNGDASLSATSAAGPSDSARAGEVADVAGAAGNEEAAAQVSMPVRIPLTFFEKSPVAQVVLADQTEEGPVSWNLQDPTAPAPGEGALADFRDRKGCAQLQGGSDGLKLCFNVMGDVDSVGLNEREMTVEGLSGARLKGVAREGKTYKVNYEVPSAQDPSQAVNLQIALKATL